MYARAFMWVDLSFSLARYDSSLGCPLPERVSVGDGAQSISPPSHNSERMATSSRSAVPGGRVSAAMPLLPLSPSPLDPSLPMS